MQGAILAFTPIPGTDDVSLNVTRVKCDHEDPRSLSRGLAEARAQIEGLGQVDHHLDAEIDVIEGDQEQEEFPAVAVQLLTQHVGVVEGDDALPALVSHFLEDHPGCHQGQNAANEANK